ncbi:MAG: nucleoside diphosphate kinase regulator [Ignavibacteriaceae bacterium]|jgi:regulator of nucleoside diphosphate kinase|nr:nucleoside diphosphate kinase regulator [Ignavibacteriaceae bacterium]
MKKQIYITDFDMKRFKWLSDNSYKFDEMYKKNIYELEKELKDAIVVEPKDIPADVVTMNSKFKIKDLETDKESEYTLVFPFDADIEQNKLSIFAPIGIAVIGYKSGDTIEWTVPSGKRRIKIEEISYQPEREGHYNI